ncbi:VOC family protein [Candidatus Gottesmanbacteria bacterium]|nr:VOC family protein [Candidatus Gottesmanbacteria bacterium]
MGRSFFQSNKICKRGRCEPVTPGGCNVGTTVANREGYGHIAFQVDDIELVLKKAIEHGGKKVGKVVSKEYKKGTSTYIYMTDPEGNIVELQYWTPK